MHHLNVLKFGFSVIAALSGNANATPADLALELIKRVGAKKTREVPTVPRHCGVCHDANVRLLAA